MPSPLLMGSWSLLRIHVTGSLPRDRRRRTGRPRLLRLPCRAATPRPAHPIAAVPGDVQRTARDQDHDHRDAGGAEPVDGLHVGIVQGQIPGPVAVVLGVRGLAHDGDRRVVGRVDAGAVLAVGDGRVRVGDLADAVQDRRARRDRARLALPGDRPAAGLHADVVGAAARDEDLVVVVQREDVVLVLQQHLRLGDRPPRQLPVLGTADRLQVPAVGHRMLEQAQLELLRQDAAVRVVDALHRNVAVLHLVPQVVDEPAPFGRHHHHVDPGVDRGGDLVLRESGLPVDLVDAVVVGDDKALKPSSPFSTSVIRYLSWCIFSPFHEL